MQQTELSYPQNCQLHNVLLLELLKRPIKKNLNLRISFSFSNISKTAQDISKF